MITGHGIDIVDVERFYSMDIQRLDSVASRILSPNEHTEYTALDGLHSKVAFVARAWAVKEAVAKSFGTGIRDAVIWKNIVLGKTDLGQPTITFANELVAYADNKHCYVSISHDKGLLIASAILSV
jgi:holo-[acyl-carrier protein] synthase